jgi:uncharacterized protein (TIGR02217 family)
MRRVDLNGRHVTGLSNFSQRKDLPKFFHPSSTGPEKKGPPEISTHISVLPSTKYFYSFIPYYHAYQKMFYEIRFPEEIPIKSVTTIEFDTNVVTSKNGKESRTANRKCRMIYNISSGMERRDNLDKITDFFRLVKGRGIGFRYRDWLDFHAERQVIAKSDGLTGEFQLIKVYSNPLDGSLSYIREITKPLGGSVKIYIDDGETDQFEVDSSSGKIYMDTVPSENSIVRATFDFDVPVRFDTDRLEIHMQDRLTGEIGSMRIIEII